MLALSMLLASCASAPDPAHERPVIASAEAMADPGPLYSGKAGGLSLAEVRDAWAQDRAVAAICIDQKRALVSVIRRRQ